MAKIDLKFLCSHDSKEKDFIKVELALAESKYNFDSILIHVNQDNEDSFIFLDKSTAIKFAKTLRTEINKIQD